MQCKLRPTGAPRIMRWHAHTELSLQWSLRVHCINGKAEGQANTESVPEASSVHTSTSDSDATSVNINVNADSRRTLLVKFTCDRCGALQYAAHGWKPHFIHTQQQCNRLLERGPVSYVSWLLCTQHFVIPPKGCFADTRSERLVNPEAYAKGTVFVQCEGCDAWHQLVDHMGLIQEYDLREPPVTSGVDEQHS